MSHIATDVMDARPASGVAVKAAPALVKAFAWRGILSQDGVLKLIAAAARNVENAPSDGTEDDVDG